MASTSQDTLAFSILSDLAIFYPFSIYASNISTVYLFYFNYIYTYIDIYYYYYYYNKVDNKWRNINVKNSIS
jgi:hypothetical protein